MQKQAAAADLQQPQMLNKQKTSQNEVPAADLPQEVQDLSKPLARPLSCTLPLCRRGGFKLHRLKGSLKEGCLLFAGTPLPRF